MARSVPMQVNKPDAVSVNNEEVNRPTGSDYAMLFSAGASEDGAASCPSDDRSRTQVEGHGLLTSIPRPPRCKRCLVVLSMLAFTVGATWPLIGLGSTLYWGDVLLYFLPALEFTRKAFAEGRIPLWNPHILCGQPFIGNPQSTVLYPISALLPLASASHFMSVSVILHTAIACSGTYRYARGQHLSRAGALLASGSFVGGAAFLLRLQFLTMIQAMAWMPWILYCSLRLTRGVTMGRVSAMAAVTGISLLAGHVQVSYLSALLGIAVAGWALRDVAARQRWRRVGGLSASTAIGALAAAVYWLPAMEVVRLSARPELALGRANRFSVAWPHVIGMIWPGFVGSPVSGDYWAPGNVWEPALFIGVVQLALAIAGLSAWRASSVVRLHAWIALFSLWLAFGVWGGLYAAAYVAIPGMSVFHDPARFGIACTFGLAYLAGAGADRIRRATGRSIYALVPASIVLLLAFTTRMTPTVSASELEYRPRLLAITSAGRIYSGMREDTWKRYVRYSDYGPESGRYVHELTDTLMPNTGMRYGMDEAGGYEPVPLKSSSMFEALLRQSLSDQSPTMVPLAAHMNVGHILMPVGLHKRIPDLVAVKGRESVFRVAGLVPQPVQVYGHTRVIPDILRASAVFGSSQFPRGTTAVVSRSVGLPQGVAQPAVRPRYKSITWRAGRGGAKCDIHGLERAGLLVMSVSATPGWTVEIDGRRVSSVRANGAFLGTVVPSGDHTVRIRYEPAAFRVGLFFSLVGVLAVTAIGTAAVAKPYSAGKLASSCTI